MDCKENGLLVLIPRDFEDQWIGVEITLCSNVAELTVSSVASVVEIFSGYEVRRKIVLGMLPFGGVLVHSVIV